ncbi:MAG: S-ribosylhomocysteine lyase [Erysipelotrichaceae bacterium]|nr:S-ribosylhomocysteine lyase [Erysipelotrichaceae bacterium]
MKEIASFTVNHDILEKGMYISRIDGDVITYDIRMKNPNQGDYLSTGGMHSIEHLFATYARNSKWSEQIIYVGPMGCRTGFYLLTRDTMPKEEAIRLTRDSMKFISEFEGRMPGSERCQCGNYLDHNVEEARAVAKDMLEVLKNYTPEMMIYRED